jgi:hypothetical protein
MTTYSSVSEAEEHVHLLSADLIAIRDAECLLCYFWRMLAHGCAGLRWAKHYRDVRAPRATAMEDRLGRVGGFCDCEIFLNGYEPAPQLWVRPEPVEEDGVIYQETPDYPENMPPCRGARRGSIRGCSLWVRQQRGYW